MNIDKIIDRKNQVTPSIEIEKDDECSIVESSVVEDGDAETSKRKRKQKSSIIPKVPEMDIDKTSNRKVQTTKTIISSGKPAISGKRKNLKSSPSSLVYEFTRYGLLECDTTSDSIKSRFEDFDLMKKSDKQCSDHRSTCKSNSPISTICNAYEVAMNKRNLKQNNDEKHMIGKLETAFPFLPTFSPITSRSHNKKLKFLK